MVALDVLLHSTILPIENYCSSRALGAANHSNLFTTRLYFSGRLDNLPRVSMAGYGKAGWAPTTTINEVGREVSNIHDIYIYIYIIYVDTGGPGYVMSYFPPQGMAYKVNHKIIIIYILSHIAGAGPHACQCTSTRLGPLTACSCFLRMLRPTTVMYRPPECLK